MEKLNIKKNYNRGRKSKRPTDKVLVAMYEDYTAIEIADMLHVPPTTVCTWIYNSRKEHEKDCLSE